MRTHLLTIVVLLAAHGAAHAQVTPQRFGQPIRQAPALSPYLNLVRGGNPAVNYYLGTLVEFDRRNFEAQILSQPEMLLQQNPGAGDLQGLIPRVPPTGHMAAFGYTTPFFNASSGFYNVGINRTFIPYNPGNTGIGMGNAFAQGAGATGGQQPGATPQPKGRRP